MDISAFRLKIANLSIALIAFSTIVVYVREFMDGRQPQIGFRIT